MGVGDETTPEALKGRVELGGMALYESTQLQALSLSMRELMPVTEELVAKWLMYWRAKGFIDA